jgi:flagellar biosynthesis/type III secretory pathway chaperone
MLAASDAGVVRAILDTDMKAVHELRALLLEERAALAAREPDALDRVVQRKLECLQCLQRNDQARQRMLARYRGIEWTTLLHAIDPTLTDSWQALRQLLEEVADLGRTNERHRGAHAARLFPSARPAARPEWNDRRLRPQGPDARLR